jgi:tRNA(Phe) wybutosine-synthesizing methylase Tyw3
MDIDFRRNLQNAGTIFVGAVQKSADSAMAFSRGAAKRYGVTSLSSKKERIAGEIIDRVAVLLKEGTSEVCRDETLSRLVARLNEVEQELAQHKKQQGRLANPLNSLREKCESSISSIRKRFF